MEGLTSLDLLYIVLSMFVSIVGTLLVIVLLRVIKILGPVMEIVDYYNRIKKMMAMYASIPGLIKEKIVEIVKGGKNNKEDDEYEQEPESKK